MRRLIEGMDEEIHSASAASRPITYDPERFSWTRRMEDAAKKGERLVYDGREVVLGSYRPFCKQWVYYDRVMNEMTYQQPRLFPLAEGERAKGPTNNPISPSCAGFSSTEEMVGKAGEMTYQQPSSLRCLDNVVVSFTGGSNPSCLVSRFLPDLHFVGDSQCFPLYWYEEREVGSALFDANDYVSEGGQTSLFGNGATRKEKTYVRHDAITDEALRVFREAYPHAFLGRYKKDGGEELSKEDVFYYVYGVLHSSEYRRRFASNLQKELPRIPLAADFAAFSRAGRALAELHLNYESVEPWGSIEEEGDSANPGRTVKMRFGKCKKTEDNPNGIDRTTLYVSEGLTLRGIPEEAYGYVVNGRSAIEWLMDRYQIRTDKASGIVNDPNEYSDDSRYIVDLVKSVVTVAMQTLEIVAQLPSLGEMPQPKNWPSTWKAVIK